MSDFKMPDSYYIQPDWKCELCNRDDESCDCCGECDSLHCECECSPIAEYMPTAVDLRDDIVISFRLDKDIHKELREMALYHERTVSQIIRFAIRDYLNNGAKK